MPYGPKPLPLMERIARRSKLGPKGCLLWTGTTYKSGHGRLTIRADGRRYFVRPHRVAWEDAYGPIPEGMHVHHKCGEPRCWNVRHLALLTPKEHRQEHLMTCPNCGHVMFGNGNPNREFHVRE